MSEKIESQTVTMAHGAGGKQTSELIDKVFAAHFANPDLTADDAAVLNPPVGKMAVSTDGFIVSPAFFPGGNIGKLSIDRKSTRLNSSHRGESPGLYGGKTIISDLCICDRRRIPNGETGADCGGNG